MKQTYKTAVSPSPCSMATANLDMDTALETIATDFEGTLKIVGDPYLWTSQWQPAATD
ncbi:MAG: hypothetical protein DHS20C20_33960 [Ardenticatenaceae bacterium]|nr:MAG: hypothetical protein DHS20C20_33960 [Ardenticatenaceae bacterium]